MKANYFIQGVNPGSSQKRADPPSRVSYQMQMDDERVQKREAKKLAKQQVCFFQFFNSYVFEVPGCIRFQKELLKEATLVDRQVIY